MKQERTIGYKLVVLVLAFVSIVGAWYQGAAASDWPQWQGPQRDNRSRETGLLKRWPEDGPRLLWSVDGLGKGFSTAAVADGLVYVTGLMEKEGILSAIEIDGSVRWRESYGPEWTGSHRGTRTTPTVDGERVYVMSGTGRVVCFDAKSGKQKWAVDALERFGGENINWGISESVLVGGDKVICTPGGKDATVAALDKKTGATVWTSKGLSDKAAYCSAILVERGGRRLVVTVTARAIVGIDAEDGTVVWEYPNKIHDGEPRDVNPNSPVYQDGGIYVTSRFVGGIKLKLSEDGASVSKAWEDEKLDPHHGGVVLFEGFIYGAGTERERWMCLDWQTGEVKYEHKWLGKGSVTYADGMLYCYEEKKGTVGLVKASPEGFEIVSSFVVSEGTGEHWAHPVVSGGRLYIRHGDALMAYDIRGQ